MDEKLKHRIVGGVVLCSVAVIAAPLLFNSDNSNKNLSISETAIPANPQANLKTINIPVVDTWSDKKMTDVVPEPIVSSQEVPPQNLINPTVKQSALVTSPASQEILPQAEEVVAQKQQKPSTLPTQSRPTAQARDVETKPKMVTAPATGKAWVVQVGSFSERANAERLRDKLIKSGYRAFVSQSRANNRNVVRVRVGPELVRKNADKLSKKLQKELSMQTMVIEHR